MLITANLDDEILKKDGIVKKNQGRSRSLNIEF
jgi:hypothetical protein